MCRNAFWFEKKIYSTFSSLMCMMARKKCNAISRSAHLKCNFNEIAESKKNKLLIIFFILCDIIIIIIKQFYAFVAWASDSRILFSKQNGNETSFQTNRTFINYDNFRIIVRFGLSKQFSKCSSCCFWFCSFNLDHRWEAFSFIKSKIWETKEIEDVFSDSFK